MLTLICNHGLLVFIFCFLVFFFFFHPTCLYHHGVSLVLVHMSVRPTNHRAATSARLWGRPSAAAGEAALINTTMSAPKR